MKLFAQENAAELKSLPTGVEVGMKIKGSQNNKRRKKETYLRTPRNKLIILIKICTLITLRLIYL